MNAIWFYLGGFALWFALAIPLMLWLGRGIKSSDEYEAAVRDRARAAEYAADKRRGELFQ